MTSDVSRREQLESLGRNALNLAIARYLIDHPEASERAGDWVDPPVEAWEARPIGDLGAEATRLLDELESWKNKAEADAPDLWSRERQAYTIAKMTLQSARSGAFGSSSGPLHDFLRQVGAGSQRLDFH